MQQKRADDVISQDLDELAESERPNKRVKVVLENPEGISSQISQEDYEDEEEEFVNREEIRSSDLYLDTINRAILDFDFEKVCSVSLSNVNTYGCLVCGKYFQGRGRKSYAYAHSIHEDHHVFINLETTK
ncbi:hypothetical protein C0992_012479, partial [Termitomyces sp. T32_za158]